MRIDKENIPKKSVEILNHHVCIYSDHAEIFDEEYDPTFNLSTTDETVIKEVIELISKAHKKGVESGKWAMQYELKKLLGLD